VKIQVCAAPWLGPGGAKHTWDRKNWRFLTNNSPYFRKSTRQVITRPRIFRQSTQQVRANFVDFSTVRLSLIATLRRACADNVGTVFYFRSKILRQVCTRRHFIMPVCVRTNWNLRSSPRISPLQARLPRTYHCVAGALRQSSGDRQRADASDSMPSRWLPIRWDRQQAIERLERVCS